jgi:hypothetical protein
LPAASTARTVHSTESLEQPPLPMLNVAPTLLTGRWLSLSPPAWPVLTHRWSVTSMDTMSAQSSEAVAVMVTSPETTAGACQGFQGLRA